MAEIARLKATVATQSQHISSLEHQLDQQHYEHQTQLEEQRRHYQTQLVTQHLKYLQHHSKLHEIQVQQHQTSQARIESMTSQTLSLFNHLALLQQAPSVSTVTDSPVPKSLDSGSGEVFTTDVPVGPPPPTPMPVTEPPTTPTVNAPVAASYPPLSTVQAHPPANHIPVMTPHRSPRKTPYRPSPQSVTAFPPPSPAPRHHRAAPASSPYSYTQPSTQSLHSYWPHVMSSHYNAPGLPFPMHHACRHQRHPATLAREPHWIPGD